VSIELIQVNLAWCIVDKSVPGWRTIETHGEEDRAIRRLAALKMGPKSATGRAQVVPAGGEEAPEDPLMIFLDGSVRDVRARIVACEDAPTLKRLSVVEDEQAGRKTVLKALKARISALS